MVELSLQLKLKKSKDVVHSNVPPNIVLLNLNSGYYFSTNEIGASIWEMCDGKNSIADIMKEVGAIYQKPLHEIEADIQELLTDMIKEELLEKQDE